MHPECEGLKFQSTGDLLYNKVRALLENIEKVRSTICHAKEKNRY